MNERTLPKLGERVFRDATVVDSDTPRTIRFVASDETVDRYGDIIRAEGWDLAAYVKHPVLLFGHDSRSPEIGKTRVWLEGKKLMADATLWPEGTSDFVDELWRIYKAGGNRAVSVGFLPTVPPNVIRGEPDDNGYAPITGFEFIGQELLELSVVPVPANPAALAVARSLASPETIRRLFVPDADVAAAARVQGERRRRSIALARLRVGQFGRAGNAAP